MLQFLRNDLIFVTILQYDTGWHHANYQEIAKTASQRGCATQPVWFYLVALTTEMTLTFSIDN